MRKPPLSWHRALTRPKTLLSIAVLVGSTFASFALNELIQWLYPDRPIVPDLLFTLLPEVRALGFVSEPFVFVSIVLLLWYMFRHDRRHLPFYFFTVGIGYALRSVLIVLTPLGRPTGAIDTSGAAILLGIRQYGMFPSGHTMLVAAIFFLIDGKRHPGFKWATGLACVAEMIVLLLCRGHYSIDIVGGVALAYLVVVTWMARYKERFRLVGD